MMRGTFLTAGSPVEVVDAEGARLLLVEVINQGIRDARSGCSEALAWLNDPLVSEIAQLADLQLPRAITLDALLRHPYPCRPYDPGTGHHTRRKERA